MNEFLDILAAGNKLLVQWQDDALDLQLLRPRGDIVHLYIRQSELPTGVVSGMRFLARIEDWLKQEAV